jgi:SSS family solute:Na+ symporter
MSTVSGLVNSTSTLVTLDIVQRWKGHEWSEQRLVRVGKWSGAIALLIGALFAPVVMKWENIFRYAQDLWAPMAAPVVVIFLAAALWQKAAAPGALACLWLAILSIPFTLTKSILADAKIHFLPANLENPMVFAGAYALIGVVVMICFSGTKPPARRFGFAALASAMILWLAAVSPSAIALLVLIGTALVVAGLMRSRRVPAPNLWDHSMLKTGEPGVWYASLWLWWGVLSAILVGIYVWFW